MKTSNPQTLVELLKSVAAAGAQREVLMFKQGKEWTTMTAEQLLARVRNVALGLHHSGIRKGDHVAILAESGPLWSISDLEQSTFPYIRHRR